MNKVIEAPIELVELINWLNDRTIEYNNNEHKIQKGIK